MAYTYFIRNKITDQFYYGSRSGDRIPETDLWVKYFSSSVYIKELIKLHGIESFDSKVVLINSDYDVCYWYEQLLIRDSIKDKRSLNKYYLDPDTSIKKFCLLGPKTETTKIKMREARKRYFSLESNRNAQRKRVLKAYADGILKREFTDAQRKELSERMKTNSEMIHTARRENMSQAYSLCLSEKMTLMNKKRKGILLSTEHKLNIAKSAKSRNPITDQGRLNLSNSLLGKPKSESAKEAMRLAWIKRKAKKFECTQA